MIRKLLVSFQNFKTALSDGTVGSLKAERFLITFRLESSDFKTKTLTSILTSQLEKKLVHVYYVFRLFLIFCFYFIVFYYSSVKISFIHLFIHSLEKETNQKKKKRKIWGGITRLPGQMESNS